MHQLKRLKRYLRKVKPRVVGPVPGQNILFARRSIGYTMRSSSVLSVYFFDICITTTPPGFREEKPSVAGIRRDLDTPGDHAEQTAASNDCGSLSRS